MPIWRVAAFALLTISSLTMAQPNREPGADQPDNRPEGNAPVQRIEENARFRLLTSKAVVAELNLTQAQKTQIAALPDAVRARNEARRVALARSRADADKTLEQQIGDFERGADNALADLLNAKQVERLRQLGWQHLGLSAYQQPEARQALRLRPDQDAALARLLHDWQRRGLELQHEIAHEAGGDPAKVDFARYRTRCVELSRASLNQAEALLDADQKKAWRALTGEAARLADPSAEQPDERLFQAMGMNCRLSMLVLLNHAALPKELGLEPAQARTLAALPKKLLDRLDPELMNKMRHTRFQAHQAEAHLASEMAEEARTLALALLNPDQVRRLKQLELQTQGLWAFGDMAVLEALKLTPDQDNLIAEEGHKIQKICAGDEPAQWNDPVRRLTAARKLAGPMKEGMGQVLASLDADQRKAWSTLIGAPFDVARVTEFCVHDLVFTAGPADPKCQAWRRACVLREQKKYAEARGMFEEAARLAPRHPQTLSSLAWFLATCSDDKQRDGTRAVKLAEMAIELAGDKFPMIKDTLAAAYAETGDFESAIKAAAQALEQAPAYQKSAIEGRLKRYREKMPIRE